MTGIMQYSMEFVREYLNGDQVPSQPFHSTRASELKEAVKQRLFEESSYLDCTFSIMVKKAAWDEQSRRNNYEQLGSITLTIEEDVHELLDDITVSSSRKDQLHPLSPDDCPSKSSWLRINSKHVTHHSSLWVSNSTGMTQR